MRRAVVVDASVAAKWILPEAGSAAAALLLEDDDVILHAPELITAELANTLWKRARRGELTAGDAQDALQAVLRMPVERHGHDDLAAAALAVALQHGITVYDGLYLALALSLDATLITADARLAAAAASGVASIQLLGE